MSDDKKKKPVKTEEKGSFLGKLVKLVLLLSVIAHVGMFGLYYYKHKTWPKSPGEFYTLSMTEGQKGGEALADYVKNIDWDAIKDKVTAETKQLVDKAQSYLDKEPPKPVEKPAATTGGVETATATATPEVSQAYYTEYKLGYDALKEALKYYRQSVPTMPNANENLEKALPKFREAETHFHNAKKENPDDPGLDELIQDTQRWIYDCQKRKTLQGSATK